MGAWGSDPFDNDDAADWVYRLEEGGPEGVVDALTGDGAEAAAAAAIVAHAHGVPVTLTPEVELWLQQQDPDAVRVLAPQAAVALDRVLDGSELAQLWAETGDDSWEQETRALRDALRRAS